MPKISIITPTGGRPEAFRLCENFIQNQTVKPTEWIVVDDCLPRTPCTMGQKYIRGPRNWEPDVNTQRFNLEAALKEVTGEILFLLEDDDYFAPNYIEVFLTYLKEAHIVGLSNSRYYNLKVPGWKIMQNYAHASLSQTAIRASLYPSLMKSINSGELYFDVHLWRQVRDSETPMLLLGNSSLGLGIKGMPGRGGITGYHRSKDFYLDSDFTVLKKWVGRDFNNYLPYLRRIDGAKKQNMQLSVDASNGNRARADRLREQIIHAARKTPTSLIK